MSRGREKRASPRTDASEAIFGASKTPTSAIDTISAIICPRRVKTDVYARRLDDSIAVLLGDLLLAARFLRVGWESKLKETPGKGEKIRIVTHHWSPHWNKGWDIYSLLDESIDLALYAYCFLTFGYENNII